MKKFVLRAMLCISTIYAFDNHELIDLTEDNNVSVSDEPINSEGSLYVQEKLRRKKVFFNQCRKCL